MGQKLHERLATEAGVKQQLDHLRTELRATFDKRRAHFIEREVTFQPFDEKAPRQSEERVEMQTTAAKELKWFLGKWAEVVNGGILIADGNAVAKADVFLPDGTVLATDVPAVGLLELEKRLQELLDLAKAIPTLDPTKGFTPDTTKGPGIYKARDEVRIRTKKVQRPITLSPATDKHPAQVALTTDDEPTGILTTQEWSGMLTPSEKSALLDRIETVRVAVKQARARANTAPLPRDLRDVGEAMTAYITAGVV